MWPSDLIEIPGADFKPHIDRLLKLARVVNTTDTRLRLDICLVLARAEWDWDQTRKGKIPTKELSTLETNIKRVQSLLQKSEKYSSSKRIRVIHCPVGEGTVATKTFERGRRGGRHETVPHGGMIASINIQRTLDIVLRKIRQEKRSRARPREKGKRSIVAYAAKFFREYSDAALTTYPSGQFANFCRSFYEAATGEELLHSDGLQLQIRAEAKTPTFPI